MIKKEEERKQKNENLIIDYAHNNWESQQFVSLNTAFTFTMSCSINMYITM